MPARYAAMPRVAAHDNMRMNLRVLPETKARLLRAAVLRQTDLTDFVIQAALREAKLVIDAAESVNATRQDGIRVLALLDDPPAPNARLLAAIEASAKRR